MNKEKLVIGFSKNDLAGVLYPHGDPLVIKMRMKEVIISRVLVDNGSSADIMFYLCFDSLNLKLSQLEPYHRPLIGFAGEKVFPLGTIKLDIFIGTWHACRTERIRFFVMDKNVQSSYNIIMGRVGLKKFEAVPSIVHQSLKFPINFGVGVVKGDQKVARECYYSSVEQEELEESRKKTTTYQVDEGTEIETLDPRDESQLVKGQVVESTENVILDDEQPERTTQIGSSLDASIK